jgi:hypothetical protein
VAVRLDGPRRRVQRLMVDGCVITRDPPVTSDDVLNRSTGALTAPVDDAVTIYEGACFIARSGIRNRDEDRGGVDASSGEYLVSVPFDAPPLRRLDQILVVSAQDESLTGKKLRVRSVEHGSLLVWRQASCELVEGPYG